MANHQSYQSSWNHVCPKLSISGSEARNACSLQLSSFSSIEVIELWCGNPISNAKVWWERARLLETSFSAMSILSTCCSHSNVCGSCNCLSSIQNLLIIRSWSLEETTERRPAMFCHFIFTCFQAAPWKSPQIDSVPSGTSPDSNFWR